MPHFFADPLFILLCSILTVVGMIVFLRVNPFLSLLSAALVVSFLTPLEPGQYWDENIKNVGNAFGVMAGRVGILIAMGAIIGKCMLDSGAADRIVRFILQLFGQRLVPAALLTGGFVLSIPMFYDTTFYLLVPIVRSVYKQLQTHYIFCLTAVGFGATLSHTLIPPTPGPVAVAETLGVSFGSMMIVALMVGVLTALPALGIAFLMNRILPKPDVHFEDEMLAHGTSLPETTDTETRPGLFGSFAPIMVAVVLITMQTTLAMLEKVGVIVWNENLFVLQNLLRVLGDPRFAMMLAAVTAMFVLQRSRKLSLDSLGKQIEAALIGAGIIILITAAGGAFGETLRQAGIGERLQELCQGSREAGMSGVGLLLLAFGTSALIKTAQGSSTVAIITTAGIFAGILDLDAASSPLPFNSAYLAVTIGLGSCVTGWMNDSGFWLLSRMGGIKETDALKTWTFGLVLLGLAGLLVVLLLSWLVPLTSLP